MSLACILITQVARRVHHKNCNIGMTSSKIATKFVNEREPKDVTVNERLLYKISFKRDMLYGF